MNEISTTENNNYDFNFNPNTEILTAERVFSGHIDIEPFIDNFEEKNSVSFISDSNKVILTVVDAFYHTFIDTLAKLLQIIKADKNVEVFLICPDTSYYSENMFYNEIYEIVLNKNNIKYCKINPNSAKFIVINNFYIINARIEHEKSINLIEEEFTKHIYTNLETATKKVYVSRRSKFASHTISSNTRAENYRIDNEEEVENFFKEKGFEIIHVQSFDNITDQILFFRNTRVLAGLTGSGLTNSVFMKSGGTVIELNTSFDFASGVELHNFYKEISYYKKHTWISIPNVEKSYKDLIKFMNEEMDYKI